MATKWQRGQRPLLALANRHPRTLERRTRCQPHSLEQTIRHRLHVRVHTAVSVRGRLPGRGAPRAEGVIGEPRQSRRSSFKSTMIVSPFSMSAIGPPRHASGATWPITRPTDPPEKRASVMSAIVIVFRRQSAVIPEVDLLLIPNQRHLERVLRVYVHHYNAERPHRGSSCPRRRDLASR
jgi:hypothetical protein